MVYILLRYIHKIQDESLKLFNWILGKTFGYEVGLYLALAMLLKTEVFLI